MRIPIQELILWILLPFLNFIIWFYVSHTTSLHQKQTECPTKLQGFDSLRGSGGSTISKLEASAQSLEKLLEQSKQELNEELRKSMCLKKKNDRLAGKTNSFSESDHHKTKNGEEDIGATCQPLNVNKAKGRNYVTFEETMEFEKWRRDRLASMTVEIILKTYTDDETAILHYDYATGPGDPPTECQSFEHHMIGKQQENCFAVVYGQETDIAYNIARFDQDIDIYGLSISNPDPSQIDKYSAKFSLNKHNHNHLFPSGFFRKVPKDRGRERTKDKLGKFLKYFDVINHQFEEKIQSHNIKEGDDLIVMVVNEGELDLYLNFACSCKLHGISLSNIYVFAGSEEMIPMVEATGAMATYHVGYAAVSRKASTDYLDRVFVDMMWFKAFSVYLVLRHKLNVLFQDVDLVWFHDPLPYFHTYLKEHQDEFKSRNSYVEAFFSDDGQRSRRYTPFYANSGFYYLIANERSEYFTWSIMIAMDAIQVLGSHQNVFTTRLIEGVALNTRHTKILTLEEFPTGIMYHHNQQYMKQLKKKEVDPYNFHMCWTQGKPDKLIYLRKAKMWYLTETCSPLEALIEDPSIGKNEEERARMGKLEPGPIYQLSLANQGMSIDQQWSRLGEVCCMAMDGAP